jgi:hypothetical protein
MDLPLTDDLLASAGRRTIAKLPPTSKSDHEYKDCLIWESILTLPSGSVVHFVSRDKAAFCTEDEFREELTMEARERGIQVHYHHSLESALSLLQRPHYTEDAKRTYATFEQRIYAGRALVDGREYHDTSVILCGSCDWFEAEQRIAEFQVESETLIDASGGVLAENRKIWVPSGTMSGQRQEIAFRARGPLIVGAPTG